MPRQASSDTERSRASVPRAAPQAVKENTTEKKSRGYSIDSTTTTSSSGMDPSPAAKTTEKLTKRAREPFHHPDRPIPKLRSGSTSVTPARSKSPPPKKKPQPFHHPDRPYPKPRSTPTLAATAPAPRSKSPRDRGRYEVGHSISRSMTPVANEGTFQRPKDRAPRRNSTSKSKSPGRSRSASASGRKRSPSPALSVVSMSSTKSVYDYSWDYYLDPAGERIKEFGGGFMKIYWRTDGGNKNDPLYERCVCVSHDRNTVLSWFELFFCYITQCCFFFPCSVLFVRLHETRTSTRLVEASCTFEDVSGNIPLCGSWECPLIT